MRRYLVCSALLSSLVLAEPCWSQVEIVYQGRRVGLQIGVPAPRPGLLVQQPPLAPPPAQPPIVQPPPGIPLEIAPPASPIPVPGERIVPPLPIPLPPPGIIVPNRPPTVREFAGHFQPVCGNYQVALLHPYTGCPVTVCFRLPAGCPRVEVKTCLRTRLIFDYGRDEVEIIFLRNGQVKVDY